MYLVTGATGNVGSEVAAQLLAAGEKVRVLTRDAAKVAHWGDRVEAAIGDFTQPASFAQAVAGVDGIFLMSGSPDIEEFRQLIATAKSQGSLKLVFLSTIFAGIPNVQIGQLHKQKEDLIRESGLPAAFVRAGGFMTNVYQWIGPVKAEGLVYNALGSGKFSTVAPEDIAAVAVKALTAPKLSGEVFEVTSDELLSTQERVDILAGVLGKPLSCLDVPVEAAVQGLLRTGVAPQIAAAVGQSFEVIREGRATLVTDTVNRVLGRPPKTFETWVRQHVFRFA